MPNLTSSPAEGSPEFSSARPATAQPSFPPRGSRPPLRVEASSSPDGFLPLANVDAAPTMDPGHATLNQPRSLDGRDHEMIDFLVQKAIETCMPRRPEPPSPPGARQRSINRKP
jgi:hypothetical protein